MNWTLTEINTMKQNSLQIQIYFEIHIICNFDLTNIKPMKIFFAI